jgi:hypothetical protein
MPSESKKISENDPNLAGTIPALRATECLPWFESDDARLPALATERPGMLPGPGGLAPLSACPRPPPASRHGTPLALLPGFNRSPIRSFSFKVSAD